MEDSSRPSPESTSGWSETAWIFLASLALLCAMALPGLLGALPSLDDLGALHYPLRVFYASCLARGQAFDWMPSLFGGCFITAEGELGAYHPFHLLIYRLFSPDTAFQIELLSGYPFLFTGMVFFLRDLVPRRDAAWFGAMAFTFSAYTMLHFVHPHLVAVTAHIPWLLAAISAAGKHPGPGWSLPAAGLALLTASQLLLGHPPSIWLSLLSEAAWAGFLYRFSYYPYLRIAAFKGLGLLIGMLQLLPTWDILQESARNHPDPDFLMSGSWHPINLFQLLSPYLTSSRVIGFETHEFALYVGAVPLTLGTWFFLSHLRRPARTGLIAFLAFSLVLSLILASGSFGGLALVQTWLPLVGKFRVPARALLFVHLIWSVLAALAWSALTRDPGEEGRRSMRRVTWLLACLSILIPASLFLLFGKALSLAHPAGIAAGPLLVFLSGIICQGMARKALWAVPAAILFTAIDLGCYGISYAIYSPPPPGLERWMRDDAPHSPGDRIAAIPRTFGNAGKSGAGNRFLLLGLRQIDGYLALEPKSRLFGDAASVPALRAAGVAWVPAIASPTQPELLLPVSEHWYKVPDPAPRIRLVTNTVQSLRPDQDIRKIDPLSAVLTECRLDLEPGVPGTATLLAESPGILAIRTSASTTQLLAIADRFHPGWQATIDGQAQAPLRINGDFLGLIVSSGTHRINLEFRPSSLIWGRNISLFGVALLALMLAWHPTKRFDQPVVASEMPADGQPDQAPQHPALRLFTGTGILLIGLAALFYRIADLSTVPGINGDEAWYGVQMGEILAGQEPAWRTPTGNPINPFHSGPLLALLTLFRPAFWILRVPSLTASILFMVLTLVLLMRRFGPWAGISGALLAAASPQLIGYARFGWDASQTPLFCALALFWTLERRFVRALIVLLASLVVHPTNLFLLPVIVVPLLCGPLEKRGVSTRQALVASLALMGSAILAAWTVRESGWQPDGTLGTAVTHLTTPGEWEAFATLFGRLFSGATLIEYVAGPIGKTLLAWLDIATWLCLGIFGVAGVREFSLRNDRTALQVMLGLGWAVFGFFLVAGSNGLAPHWERYAQFLMAPVLMMAAASIGTPSVHHRKAIALFALVLGIAATQLTCVHHLYWKQLTRHGSASHRAFRSGPVEPKQWAFDLVRTAAGSLPAVIVAEDWWCGMPLRYLAQGVPGITVEDWPANGVSADMIERLDQRRFLIGFEGGPIQKLIRQLPPHRNEIHHRQIDDPDGMPILHVWSKRLFPGNDRLEPQKSSE